MMEAPFVERRWETQILEGGIILVTLHILVRLIWQSDVMLTLHRTPYVQLSKPLDFLDSRDTNVQGYERLPILSTTIPGSSSNVGSEPNGCCTSTTINWIRQG